MVKCTTAFGYVCKAIVDGLRWTLIFATVYSLLRILSYCGLVCAFYPELYPY
jgi:hypothetical protein